MGAGVAVVTGARARRPSGESAETLGASLEEGDTCAGEGPGERQTGLAWTACDESFSFFYRRADRYGCIGQATLG